MRNAMVEQLLRYKIRDTRVLHAMGKVKRHMYIPEKFRRENTAYGDHPWVIGYGQTISQPYIVACAPEKVPPALVEQLNESGRMIIPAGEYTQRLVILRKKDGAIIQENDLAVRFVPMIHGQLTIQRKSTNFDRNNTK
ncbi:MAG: hypothetical protein R6V06_04955 [Kiritimatiellia bacterium]